MLHRMKLRLAPFEKIKDGSKTIELRLFDEKRQKVQIGDFIEFICLDCIYRSDCPLCTDFVEISEVLLTIPSDDPMSFLGYPDALKVRSCMTLFRHAAPEETVYQRVLDKFCQGNEDEKALRILGV